MNRTLGRIVAAATATLALVASALVASQSAQAVASHTYNGSSKVLSYSIDNNTLRPTAQGVATYSNSALQYVTLPADLQLAQTFDYAVGLKLNATKATALQAAGNPLKFVLTTSVPGGETLVYTADPTSLTKNQASVVVTSSVPGATIAFTDAKNGTITLPYGLTTEIEFVFTLKLSTAGYVAGSYLMTPTIWDSASAASAIPVNTSAPYAPTDTKVGVSVKRYAYTALSSTGLAIDVPGYSRVTYNVSVCAQALQLHANDELAAWAAVQNTDVALASSSGSWLQRPSTIRGTVNTVLKLNATDVTKGVRATATLVKDNTTSPSSASYITPDLIIWNNTVGRDISALCADKPAKPRISINASTKKLSVEVPTSFPTGIGGAVGVTVWTMDSSYTSVAKAQFDTTLLNTPTSGFYKKVEVNLVKPTAVATSTAAGDLVTLTTKTDYVAKISFIDSNEGFISADSDQSNYTADIAQPIATAVDQPYALNAGGNNVVLTGRNFAAAGNQKIVGVQFNNPWSTPILVSTFSIFGDTLTVKVPAYASHPTDYGDPALNHPVSRWIYLKLQDGSLINFGFLAIQYIGTVKATQTVTMDVWDDSFTGLTSQPDMTVTTTQTVDIQGYSSITPTVTVKSVPSVATSPVVCAVTTSLWGTAIHFSGNAGDCTVTTTGPATAAYNAASVSQTYTVRKSDDVTVNKSFDDNWGGYLLGGTQGFIPEVTSVSGRPVTLTVDAGSEGVCETPTVDSATMKVGTVYAKPNTTYQTCYLTAKSGADSTEWKQTTTQFYLTVADPTLGTSTNPLIVPSTTSTNKWVDMGALRVAWNRTTGDMYVTSRSKYIGKVTATLKFTDKTGVAQTCVIDFGILTKITGPTLNAIQNTKSPTVCTDPTVKAKLKAAATAKVAAQSTLPVTLSVTRVLNQPATNVVYKASETLPKLYLNLN